MTITAVRSRRLRTRHILRNGGAALVLMGTTPGIASVSTSAATASPVETWSYSDTADLFVAAPVVARVRVVDAIPVPTDATGTGRDKRIRYYLVAEVTALIRGADGIAPRVAWLADVVPDTRGRPPKLKRASMLLAAFPVAARPGELRLAARDAMVPWSAPAEARVRAIVASGLAADAPPRVTGIASAFHSPGNLPGESETQIFLATASAQPVSLSILRRPGSAPRWAVALGEIVDEAARPPERDTLGWYRLACFLPAELPAETTAQLSASNAEAARADYRFVMAALGVCTRTRH